MNQAIPLVSVGLPVFNEEKFLAETLDSLLSQSFNNLEIIISDNVSTDRTAGICLTYAAKDSRIRYYRQEKHLGASHNYNYTFGKARGEYFMWASGHDLWEKDFLSSCLKILENEPDVVYCYSRVDSVTEGGKKIPHFVRGNTEIMAAHPIVRFHSLMWQARAVWISAYGLARTRVLKKTRLFSDVIISDWVLFGELSLLGKFAQVPKILYHYRLNCHDPDWVTKQTLAIFLKPKLFPHWTLFTNFVSIIIRAPLSIFGKIIFFITVLVGAPAFASFTMANDLKKAVKKAFWKLLGY